MSSSGMLQAYDCEVLWCYLSAWIYRPASASSMKVADVAQSGAASRTGFWKRHPREHTCCLQVAGSLQVFNFKDIHGIQSQRAPSRLCALQHVCWALSASRWLVESTICRTVADA